MTIDFNVEDIVHRIPAKFTPAFLPDAKKPYNLKPVHQSELDIHAVASKADTYNITTSPKVIEEGFTAAIELMKYLALDGFKIKTSLFNLGMSLPGEYDGSETRMPDGVFPAPRFQPSPPFRKYIEKHALVEFCGKDESEGIIGWALDEATGRTDETVTVGGFLTIHGIGLKIEVDEAHKDEAGLFFEPEISAEISAETPTEASGEGGTPIKAGMIAVNEPRTLKVIVPPGLEPGKAYTLKVVTQKTSRHGNGLLKSPREVHSDFMLTARIG